MDFTHKVERKTPKGEQVDKVAARQNGVKTHGALRDAFKGF